MTNTEFVSDGFPFGFSRDEEVQAAIAWHAAPFIPCRVCGAKTTFNSRSVADGWERWGCYKHGVGTTYTYIDTPA